MDTFVSNVERVSSNLDFDISILDGDAESLDQSNFQHKINVIFYDGDNDPSAMWRFYERMELFTDNVFTLIMDDANIEQVVKTTKDFVTSKSWKLLYERELLNNQRMKICGGTDYTF